MFNFNEILSTVTNMQENIKRMKEKLNDLTVVAEAGGGMVKVTCNGNKRVIKVEIDPDIMNDREMVEDLVCAATNKAIENAEELSAREMQSITKGMMPDLGGLDMSAIMGKMM